MGTWDERVDKAVGRPVSPISPLSEAGALLETLGRLMPGGVCQRGVWRFKTFEEADEWAMAQAARNRASRR